MRFAFDSALARWREIQPQDNQRPRPLESRELSHWIETDVCRVVDQLAVRSDFQEMARAPIERLCCGEQSAEGRLIAQIDSRLVQTAAHLVHFLEGLAAREEFREWHSENPTALPRQMTVQESISISSAGTRTIEGIETEQEPSDQVAEIDRLIRGLQYIAGRPWRALTSVNDYFGSSAQLNLTPAELQRQREWFGERPPENSEFSQMLQPRLQTPDDFIFICFELRVEYWGSSLNQLGVRISRLLHQCPVVTANDRLAYQDSWCPVQPLSEQLRRLWQESQDAAERLAALRLVQIRAAFHPERTLDWLPEAVPFVRNAYYFRDRIEKRKNRQIAQSVAEAVSTLSGLCDRLDDLDIQIRNYVRTHPLCVIEGRLRREVYWQGELLGIDWRRHDRAWILFSSLVEQAISTGQGVDSFLLEDISIRDARQDLNRLLPAELSTLIMGSASTALRLDLPRSQIYYGIFQQHERLEPLLLSTTAPLRLS